MRYIKGVKWVWDPLLEGLKGKITIGMDRILKKPLIKEVQKLPITKSGISNDGFLGYIFYGLCFHQTIH